MDLPGVKRQHGLQGEEGSRLGNGNLGPNFSFTSTGPVALGKVSGVICKMECYGMTKVKASAIMFVNAQEMIPACLPASGFSSGK